ncbi:MAG TPA: preprotein translocase subunit SecE [Microthrixaceae bacterium]|nr:preprotein translocase subunit SecE [Microthrixaceae bacterium]
MQKRGMADGEGSPVATRERRQPQVKAKEERTKPRQYLREVMGELRKTSWPTRAETIRLGTIVLIAIIFMTALIFGLDFLFGEAIGRLMDTTDSSAASAAAAALMI